MILTVAANKGGCGKTTTAAALAQAAVKDGKKVLAIDLDGQADLTYTLKGYPDENGSYALLNGTPLPETIQHTAQGIDLAAGIANLSVLHSEKGSARRLQKALEPYKTGYDMIIIDSPPSQGELTFNALQAATDLIIPLAADRFSLQALYQIADIVEIMRNSNPDINILGSIITNYDRRPTFNRFIRDTIKQQGEEMGIPLLLEIRQGVAVKEAQGLQQSLFEYASRSNPAADYMELYTIIKERM